MQTKKLLGTTLALGLSVSMSTANAAEMLKNLKLSGQFDLQATSARNVTDFTTRQNNNGGATRNDRIGDAQTRIMLSLDWDILDDVHSKVTIRKSDRNYGTAGGGNANTNANSQAIDAAGVLGNTFVDQAYIKVDKVFSAVDMTMGRQFYGQSGDIVMYFGPSDKALYGLPTTSVDAVRADWSNEQVGLTALVGKITGHAVGVAAAADVDVHGLNAMIKGNDMWNAGAYLWRQVTHNIGALGAPASFGTAGGKNDYLYVAGVKAKVKAGPAWAGAEFAKNFGQNRTTIGAATANAAPGNASYTGWALKVDLGAKLDAGVASAMPWAHFGYGSGDGSADNRNHNFTAISPDYRPGSIYGRFAVAAGGASLGSGTPGVAINSNALSNRKIWGLGVKATPAALSKLTAGVSYWDYSFAVRPGVGAGAGQKHIGSEADVDLSWQHSENVTLGAGVGQFWPGGYEKETIQSVDGTTNPNTQRGNNPANLAYFDVRVKF